MHFTRLKIKRMFVIFILCYMIFPYKAYAYIDLGTGSYIIQILIASFIGIIFSMKIYWRKVKTYFVNLFYRRHQNGDDGGNGC